MSNEPMVFDDSTFGQTRTIVDENGGIWFVAKDVALALDYPRTSINQLNNLFRHIPQEWICHKPIMVRSESSVEQTRSMLCISEQGLYFFLGRSDKPKALPYQKKVAGEIIPSLRKDGFYSTRQLTMEDLCKEYLATCEKQRQLEADINKVTAEKQLAITQRDAIGDSFGAGPTYYKVSEIPWLHEVFRIGNQRNLHPALGNRLAQMSALYGYEVKKCQADNGGHWWRAYHSDMIDTLYGELKNNRKLFRRFRKSKRRS